MPGLQALEASSPHENAAVRVCLTDILGTWQQIASMRVLIIQSSRICAIRKMNTFGVVATTFPNREQQVRRPLEVVGQMKKTNVAMLA